MGYHPVMPESLTTPILFCTFNRPELTARVFESIRQQQPQTLFISCDGPRKNRPEEAARVAEVRSIVEGVDWSCQVHTRFADENLGCKRAIAAAIDWAFEHSEELIILEDDCLPDPTFFNYCENLLKRYRDDDRIMMISGNNFQPHPTSPHSYYFSRWTHIWGWATWKTAWKHFDVDVSSWPQLRDSQQLRSVLADPAEYKYWAETLDAQHAGEVDTWDFPWCYAVWANDGISILPERNLVSNIGFGADATHTTDPESVLSSMPTWPLSISSELSHPEDVLLNRAADDWTWQNIFLPHVLQQQESQRIHSTPKSGGLSQFLRSLKSWTRFRKGTAA